MQKTLTILKLARLLISIYQCEKKSSYVRIHILVHVNYTTYKTQAGKCKLFKMENKRPVNTEHDPLSNHG